MSEKKVREIGLNDEYTLELAREVVEKAKDYTDEEFTAMLFAISTARWIEPFKVIEWLAYTTSTAANTFSEFVANPGIGDVDGVH